MRLFKIFGKPLFSSIRKTGIEDKLPSKEYLLTQFYQRTNHPYRGGLKQWSDDDKKLFDIELEVIRELIDNYPKHFFEKIETIKDFTLDCIIPETLYKIRTAGGHLGFVFVTDKGVELYYTSTYLKSRALYPSEKEPKYDRIQLKKIILNLLK